MRKLSPFKAISHSLNAVFNYRTMALRLGMFWIPLLFLIGLAEWLLMPQGAISEQPGFNPFFETVSAIAGLAAFSSLAVSWHRFILRDELSSPTRLDRPVWRYAGNSLLIMLVVLVPVVIVALVLSRLPPGLSVLLVPLALAAGTVATRLCIKLPAVALGNDSFTFRDAWRISEGNMWQLAGVFALNAAILLAARFALAMIVWSVHRIAPAAAIPVALVIGAGFHLFYMLFSAGVFTALYGFFVEKRDF